MSSYKSKPVLGWGIIKDEFGEMFILRVTHLEDEQVGGVRTGRIGGTAYSRRHLKGMWPSEEAAQAALKDAEKIRKHHQPRIRDAENEVARIRKAERAEIDNALRGDLK